MKFATAAALAAAMTAVPPAAGAQGYKVGGLTIGHPWSRPTPPGAPTAVGYMTITNTGRAQDTLLGASTPTAASLELHQSSMAGGIMRMRAAPEGLTIAPGQTVKLQPGGYHLMFMGPKKPFAVGDHVPATLRFRRAGEMKVEFQVQEAAPEAGDGQAAKGMGVH
ncbi:MAG TPA: copper chaperone PCu(A)C [Caulobacteraceae bacterium]|nr:copper chaperone PCu(A)C [Caulobacteraceae bacterium]